MLGGLTLRLAAAFLLVAVVFSIWPGIDLWLSGLFHSGDDFVDHPWLETTRNLIWTASILTVLASLALWLAWLALGPRAMVPARLWGWALAVYVVGPGLLVNGLLKEHWGRARPAHVFRGDAEFTPPLVITDQCASNCSFVSGEAAAAVALAIVLGALLWPILAPPRRGLAVAALAAVAAAGALMRVLTGRHFLSDVLFAGFFTAFVALALWWALRIGPARQALTLPALRADARAIRTAAAQRWRRLIG